MDGHKIDAARLAEQGDRAYALADVENSRNYPPPDEPRGAAVYITETHALVLAELWRTVYQATAATVMGAVLVRSGDSLRFAR